MELEMSRQLYEKVRNIVTGGVHSNFRVWSGLPHPLYFARAKGSKIWDIDGNEYIDCNINFGALILGHAHPRVTESVKAAIETGITAGMETETTYQTAKEIQEMVPCAEVVKFCNSGTEAIMHAIQIARGYTGRELLMKPEGSYSGWYDCVLVNNKTALDRVKTNSPVTHAESDGLLRASVEKTIVFPYNDIDTFTRLVKEHHRNLAAVILTPVVFSFGVILPGDGYLNAVREVTEQYDVPLIFDEVITGFRLAPGGAQEFFGVVPDLAIFAKAMANGYPLAAVTGKKEILEVTRPGGKVPFPGTYNANQISIAAAQVCLDELRDGKVLKYIQSMMNKLLKLFKEVSLDLKLDLQVQGAGGIFTPYFTDKKVTDHWSRTTDRDKFLRFHKALVENNILYKAEPLGWGGLTAAHDSDDIKKIMVAIEQGLGKAKGIS